MAKSLSSIKKAPIATVLGAINSEDPGISAAAGLKLTNEAREYGLGLRDFLTLAVDTTQGDGENKGIFLTSNGYLNGYEATTMYLNLPTRNNFEQGIVLQAASDTFNTRPGARGLFPAIVDDMLKWTYRQDQLEKTSGLIAQSRTITGTELVSQVVDDDSKSLGSFTIPELAQIPVQTIKTSEQAVKMYKHGSAIRTSYEFNRRASLDMLTPYAARINRSLEISKVAAATALLRNGDGVNGAAEAMAISTFDADLTNGKTLKDNYVAFMKFLVKRAQEGRAINTVVGNLSAYIELFLMFTPTVGSTSTAEHLQNHGAPTIGLMLPVMKGVKFELSSTMPNGKLMCYSQEDTLEELVEANSQIAESEQAIRNQSVTYVRTENTGYRLIFGDTRTELNFTA